MLVYQRVFPNKPTMERGLMKQKAPPNSEEMVSPKVLGVSYLGLGRLGAHHFGEWFTSFFVSLNHQKPT